MAISLSVYSINGDVNKTTGSVKPGDTIDIALNLTGLDAYVGVSGEPMLLLSNGGVATYAYDAVVNGVPQPIFHYVVTPGQATNDLQVTGFAPFGRVLDKLSGTAQTSPLTSVAGDLALSVATAASPTPPSPPAPLGANQTVTGTSGDDVFVIGAGGDTIDGGAGTNTVVLSGEETDYTVAASGASYIVTDNRAGSPNGTNTLSNVQLLKFADTTDILGPAKPVIEWSLAPAGVTSDLLSGTSVGFSSFVNFDYVSLIREAFANWAAVANVDFVQVSDPGGAISSGPIFRIGAGNIAGNDGGPIVGLAHVGTGGLAISSTFAFTPDQFLSTVEHEIGHNLGLQHAPSSTPAIMDAVESNPPITVPQPWDISSVDALHGAFTPQPPQIQVPDGQADFTVMNAPPFLTVVGNDQNNVITAGGGDEVIDGGGGNNTLIAGAGDDVLNGSSYGRTVTLQPFDNPSEGLVFNGGGKVFTSTNVEVGGGWSTLLKFDLSALHFDPGARVTSAAVSLEDISALSNLAGASAVAIDEVHSSWSVGGGANNLVYTQIGTATRTGADTLTLDITTAAQDWVNDPSSNFGLLLQSVNPADPVTYFASSSFNLTPPSSGPQLSITTDTSIEGVGDDILVGGPGDDILNGGLGADKLIAGSGHTRMSGGGGVDVFEGRGVDLNGDTIADLTNGDTIWVSDADPANFAFSFSNGALHFASDGGADESIALAHIATATFTPHADASGAGVDLTLASSTACYARGSCILTTRGEIAIETLQVGDIAVTASGAERPIRWIGHRRLDLTRHSDPDAVRPVRVEAHAFGEALPRRDLYLSPGHNIAFDGALIPISALVNGASVAAIEAERIEYWHVELDAHDVILAEGLPAESYLDTGNRLGFENGGAFIEAHPDFAPKHWRETCMPLAQQGAPVEAARECLRRRLGELSYALTSEADVRLVVDGETIAPLRLSDARLAFVAPEGVRELILVSNTFVPAHTRPESGDFRRLGLGVRRLLIDGHEVAVSELDHETGWHQPEYVAGRFARRWTTGNLRLPAGARVLQIDLAGVGRYWRGPKSYLADATVGQGAASGLTSRSASRSSARPEKLKAPGSR